MLIPEILEQIEGEKIAMSEASDSDPNMTTFSSGTDDGNLSNRHEKSMDEQRSNTLDVDVACDEESRNLASTEPPSACEELEICDDHFSIEGSEGGTTVRDQLSSHVDVCSPEYFQSISTVSSKVSENSACGVSIGTSLREEEDTGRGNLSYLFDQKVLKCWKNGVVFSHPLLFFSVQQQQQPCEQHKQHHEQQEQHEQQLEQPKEEQLKQAKYLNQQHQQQTNKQTIETVVSGNAAGIHALGFITDHISTLIKEWYPGCVGNDCYNQPFVEQYALCPICRSEGVKEPYHFTLEQVFKQIYFKKVDTILCDRGHVVYVYDVYPELGFKDLLLCCEILEDDVIVYKDEEGEGVDDIKCVLGAGGFGKVYRGTYK